MEYPFKDLLPLDEVLEREGYYKDWTHLDPEVFYSLTQISEYIKTKGYGADVRLLISQLAEHFGLSVVEVTDIANKLMTRQDAVEDFNTQVIQEMTDKDVISAPEIIAMRYDLKGVSHDTASERINADFNSLKNEINQKTYEEATKNYLPMKDYLGVHFWKNWEGAVDVTMHQKYMGIAKDLGFKTVRMGLNISGLNGIIGRSTRQGNNVVTSMTFDFSREEQEFGQWLDEGFELIIYPEIYNLQLSNRSETLAFFDNFMTQVVQTFAGRGIVWEGPNEANFQSKQMFSETNFQQYETVAILNKKIGEIVKREDPNSYFVAGSWGYNQTNTINGDINNNHQFQREVENATIKGLLDNAECLSIHPYQYSTPPERLLNGDNLSIRGVISMLDYYGGKPLYLSEFGYSETNWVRGYDKINAKTAANWDIRALLLTQYLGVERYVVFQLKSILAGRRDNEFNFDTATDSDKIYAMEMGFGLYDESSESLTEKGKLFKKIITPLIDGDYVFNKRIRAKSEDTFIFEFINPQGDYMLAYWTSELEEETQIIIGDVNITPKTTPGIKAYTPTGKEINHDMAVWNRESWIGSDGRLFRTFPYKDLNEFVTNGRAVIYPEYYNDDYGNISNTPEDLQTFGERWMVINEHFSTDPYFKGDENRHGKQTLVNPQRQREWRRYYIWSGWTEWQEV